MPRTLTKKQKKIDVAKPFGKITGADLKKLGKKNYIAFLEKGLSDFKINPRHYDYRSNGAAEEKLFNLAK